MSRGEPSSRAFATTKIGGLSSEDSYPELLMALGHHGHECCL
jgi:hypothetical protein